ncbi:response regulator transcription factor [Parafrankia sp. FMc2]|uniref:response regulator transcription factor n=1 Tax=Parafrankia sp. FMc2 TaxID=3233196 RepID=UPI0034D5808B
MRLVVAEDSAILRHGLTQLLAMRGHHVVAAVGDGDALASAVAEHRPDVAVIDIRMPPTHTDEGVRAAIALRHEYPTLGMLLFSQYIETSFATTLLTGKPEGVGYLLKDRVTDIDAFVDALTRIAAGGTALDPEVVAQLLRASRQRKTLASLSPRERDVLALMAEGHSNAAIGDALTVTERAVEKHIAHIFVKLDLPPSDTRHRRVVAVLLYLQA